MTRWIATSRLVIADCRLEKDHGAGFPLVLQYLAESDPGSVIDTDVDKLPADTSALLRASPIAGDAVADAIEFTDFFDVDGSARRDVCAQYRRTGSLAPAPRAS